MSVVTSSHRRVRDWLADQLHAFVWVLLALWAPPIVFTVLVDLDLVGGAGSGYPKLRDPGLVLSIMQLVLLAASLLLMRSRRLRSWQLLCGSLAVWWAHAAWTIQGRLRLVGRSDLASRETLITLAALAVASYVVFEVRDRLTKAEPLTAPPPTSQPLAALRPDTM